MARRGGCGPSSGSASARRASCARDPRLPCRAAGRAIGCTRCLPTVGRLLPRRCRRTLMRSLAMNDLSLALAAMRLAAGARRPRRRTHAAAAQGAALCLPDRRDRLRPGADLRPVLAHRRRAASSTRRSTLRLPRAAGQAEAATRRRACPRSRTTSRRFTFRIQPGIYFADDPAFKGKPRELVAAGLRLRDQAPLRPALKSPQPVPCSRTPGSSAWPSCASEALADKKPFDYDARGRGPAGARPLHLPGARSAEPRPRFLYDLRRRRRSRRGGARGGRVLRRQDRGAPGRHRPVPARASGGAARASCSSATRASATSLYDEQPAGGRRRGAGDRRAAQGPAPADGRPGRDLRSSRRPSRAGWRSSTASSTCSSACRPSSPTMAMPNDKLAPNLAQARHPDGALSAAPTSPMSYFNMEDPVVGGYTPEKVALRRAIVARATTSSEEIRIVRKRPGDPGAVARSAAGAAGYDPAFSTEMSELRPGRARRRCSTCTATSTATATAGASMPDGSPLVLEYAHRSPTSARASCDELWKKNMDAIGIRIEFKTAKWPENLKAVARRQADDVGRRLDAARRPTADALPRAAPTARTRARPTMRASTCRPSTRLYERSEVLPDGPERAGRDGARRRR